MSSTVVLQPSGPDAPLKEEQPLIDIDYTIFLQLALFFAVAFICNRLLFRPYLRMRDERTAGIDGAREEAAHLSSEADARLDRYQIQIEEARARALNERRKIRADAAERQRQMSDLARVGATKAFDEAKQRIRAETDAARARLLPRAEELAGDISDALLGRRTGA